MYLFVLLFSSSSLLAHNGSIRGLAQDAETQSPLIGAVVSLNDTLRVTYSDELGYFHFQNLPAGSYRVTVRHLGYESQTTTVRVTDNETTTLRLAVPSSALDLQTVEVHPSPGIHQTFISSLDIQLRPNKSSQDVLRMVPGLFIAQHAGGGKADQLFLRGFDIDHGTDVSLTVDGMPVNMVSHAHGQGYADLHFVIPETIERVGFTKGPYDATVGNLATAGSVGFQTKNALDRSSIKLQGGRFDTYRAVGMFNLFNSSKGGRNQNAYLATEYFFSNGYFESPQAYNRFNGLLKYHGELNERQTLTASLSSFTSRWDASGQIPVRAVESGEISRFGAIDDTEGGNTSRTNLNVALTSLLDDQSYFRNQFYVNQYDFELYSNFTFFLNNPEDGDQIRQKEDRLLFGYNGTYNRQDQLLGMTFQTRAGLQFRRDHVQDVELSRSRGREITLERLALGDIDEVQVGVFVDETIRITPALTVNAGLRFDQFQFLYLDQLADVQERKIQSASVVSPKLSAFYQISPKVQVFGNVGYGFHSNDTRVVVAQSGEQILPKALGTEAGLVLKPLPSLLLSASAWNLELEQEFVYVGDEAVVEPSGKTRRQGIDFSVRYQICPVLFADFDYNYTFARAVEAPENEDFIPLAAEVTSIGGLTFQGKKGLSASLRYRHLGDRPANEDNSLVAEGYFLLDAVVNYQLPKVQFGLEMQNLLDQDWKEAQFETESRLRNELESVSEIHFTPGAPFGLNAYVRFTL